MTSMPSAGNESSALSKPMNAEETKDNLYNCMRFVRNLTDLERQSNNAMEPPNDDVLRDLYIRKLKCHGEKINMVYNNLQGFINKFPDTLFGPEKPPHLSAVAKLVDEATTDVTFLKTFDAVQDGLRQQHYAATYATVCHDKFTKSLNGSNRRSIYVNEPDVPTFDGSNDVHIGQREFDKRFHEFINEINKRVKVSGKVNFKRLEKSNVHSIYELNVQLGRDTFKNVLLVTRGKIDYINMYGCNEELKYVDEQRKLIDPFCPSNYHAYKSQVQKLNSQFQAYHHSQVMRNVFESGIYFIINLSSKLLNGVLSTCIVCKETLKNGLLPVSNDLKLRNYIHEECR